MDVNKDPKEGLSIKELEGYAKRHRMEVFFCLLFFLAGLFGLLLWSPSWCVILAALGAITGALIPGKMQLFARSLWQFVFRQDRTTQIIMAAIALVLAVFIAPLIFLFIGLHAGRSMITAASNAGPIDPLN